VKIFPEKIIGTSIGDKKVQFWNSKANGVGSGFEDSSPLVVVTTMDTVVISATSEFMSANQYVDNNHNLNYIVMRNVLEIPKDFSLEMIFSLDSDVTNGMDVWGQKL